MDYWETIFQRERERKRFRREQEELEHSRQEEEQHAIRKEHADELRVSMESGLTGGWGDRETWLWIVGFCFVVIAPWIMTYFLNGHAIMHQWHLGFPPTHPE